MTRSLLLLPLVVLALSCGDDDDSSRCDEVEADVRDEFERDSWEGDDASYEVEIDHLVALTDPTCEVSR